MVDQQLVSYIKTHLKKGALWKDIEDVLRSNGWEEEDIHNAFEYIKTSKSRRKRELHNKFKKLVTVGFIVSFIIFMLVMGTIYFIVVQDQQTKVPSDVSIPATIK